MTTPDGQEPEGTPEQDPEVGGTKGFTQEDLNRVAAEARRKEREKYPDYETLRARAAKADELEQEKLSEAEKLQQKATEATAKATAAEARIAEMSIRTDIQIKASQRGIVDPEAAVALISREGIQYLDDRVTGVDEALDALVASKPYLMASHRAPNLNSGNNGAVATPIKLTDAERDAARRFGLSEEEYAKHKPAPNAG
jgi:hypothetical protein